MRAAGDGGGQRRGAAAAAARLPRLQGPWIATAGCWQGQQAPLPRARRSTAAVSPGLRHLHRLGLLRPHRHLAGRLHGRRGAHSARGCPRSLAAPPLSLPGALPGTLITMGTQRQDALTHGSSGRELHDGRWPARRSSAEPQSPSVPPRGFASTCSASRHPGIAVDVPWMHVGFWD